MLDKTDLASILVNLGVDEFSRPLILKGIFGDQRKCTFAEIMKKIGLENWRKTTIFNDVPDKEDFIKNPMMMSMAFNKKKTAEKEVIKKEEVIIKNIPPALKPYYTGLTEMTEPLLSLARAKL